MIDTDIERFAALFRGAELAHGIYEITGQKSSGKKDGRAKTVREPVTAETWAAHLKGKKGIGIIPIREDNTASWGAIDVDTYPLEHSALVRRIEDLRLPSVVCRSKSGGAHCLFFTTEPVAAGDMQAKLTEFAAALGYGGCEVFPKQAQVLLERGDLGNWLNLPYFGADRSTRYGFSPDGEALSLSAFLDFAESRRLPPKKFLDLSIQQHQDVVVDGPPCLELLVAQGFPPQTRNNGLFAMGVYFQKSDPDNWRERLEEFNRSHMSPPKDAAEVLQITKSLEKKDYTYKCKDLPLKLHCNRTLCMTRKHGIGAAALRPTIGSLAKLNTEEPLWFVDVDGVRIELTTKQLQAQYLFQGKVMDAANRMPARMKEPEWWQLINELMKRVTLIDAPKEASATGHFEDLVEQYYSGRFAARSVDEVLIGKAFVEDGRAMFRLAHLTAYLKTHGFDEFGRNQIVMRLKDMGASDRVIRIQTRQVRVWVVPVAETQDFHLALPDNGDDAF